MVSKYCTPKCCLGSKETYTLFKDLTTYARNKNSMMLPGYNKYWLKRKKQICVKEKRYIDI
jgi:hypothetical protein